MSLNIGNITFDCADPQKVAAFWSQAMGMTINDGASEFFVSMSDPATPDGPNWFFTQVPEAKMAKNRLHLDLSGDDPAAEVERLVGLGAQKMADKDEWNHQWTVMQDPEGNEFCVSAAH